MDPSVFETWLTTYDNSMEYHVSLYDHLPYVRNWDYCNESTIAMYSGNIVKYYQYVVGDPITIETQDERTAVYLRSLQDEIDSKNAWEARVNEGLIEEGHETEE